MPLVSRQRFRMLVLTSVALLGACQKADRSAEPLTTANSTRSSANEWLGVWQGPEGTSLDLQKAATGFLLTIRNLDGPRTFDATESNGGITFVRDGVQETIRAGTGVDTGMKWLVDKSNCLVVRSGEGYCRG